MSLPFFVIRVLSDYHRFDGVIIGVFQRVEYVVHRRIADVMRILVFQKFADFKVVFSRKLVLQNLVPAVADAHHILFQFLVFSCHHGVDIGKRVFVFHFVRRKRRAVGNFDFVVLKSAGAYHDADRHTHKVGVGKFHAV